MQQLISQHKQQTINKIELTGNPFVDNGLAIIAALCKCENIEDLTLRKMKNFHGKGIQLARNNMKLRANYMVFINSITMQPSYSEKDKIKKYAKMTSAILNNIGHEEINEFCDFCGNTYSTDLTKLFHDNIKVKKKKVDKTNKRKTKPAEPMQHYLGRDWFPFTGSMGSDAQALPGASRSLNSCAKCLFAVQYLPQASILVNKLLALFQSTSTAFWYEWVTNLTAATRKQLAIQGGNKIETEGKKEGSGAAVNRLLEVMRNSKRYDPNASMIMYQYSNGKGADLKKQLIPNVALNFLHEATTEDIDDDIKQLLYKEGKTSYRYSFLNCIAEQQDYYSLYPSKKLNRDGASPELFLLYQRYILKYPVNSLNTAYKIAQYLKSKIDIEKIVVDIQRNHKKQTTVRKWITDMAEQGFITFDEYYDLFIRSPLDRRNPWWLVKYYMLSDKPTEFKTSAVTTKNSYNLEYKDRVIKVGTAIFSTYIAEKGRPRLVKLLNKFARGDIHRNWLITQFEKLADENKEFDYSDNWKALCINKQGEEDIYQLLYLLRLLLTSLNCTMVV